MYYITVGNENVLRYGGPQALGVDVTCLLGWLTALLPDPTETEYGTGRAAVLFCFQKCCRCLLVQKAS